MQRDVADALLDLAEADEDAAHARAQSKAAAKVTFDDIVLLADAESVDLPAAIASYLKEPDRTPSSPSSSSPSPSLAGAVTVAQLRSQLLQARRKRRKQQRKEASTAAWTKFMQQPASTMPERMRLADIVVALDDKNTDASRAMLVNLAREAPLEIGLWGGIKRVWKRAEERHDYALWAALTAAIEQRAGNGDVSYGTSRYVGKRAWRTLRDLGRAAPEMFPHVAVELLRHYDRWGACTSKVCYMREPDPLLSTWKSSPEPLLRLLEGARVDVVAKFAVDQLKKHHAEAVRALSPGRLARLVEGELPLGSVHELFLELVEKASLPLAQLREHGLHDAALKMLFSPSPKARAWAVEYARAHAKDLAVDRVIDLVRRGTADALKLGIALLEATPSSTPGLALETLAQLLLGGAPASHPIVEKKLRERIASLDEAARVAFLVECVFMGNPQLKLASTFLQERMQALELWPAEVWLRVLADERAQWNHAQAAQQAIASLNGGDPVAVLDAGRLLDVVAKKADVHVVGAWFAKAARASLLDVERVKGLVFASKTRPLALAILGNRRLVKPLELGLGWLLALAKRADPDLHRFAYQTLLEHTAPADFAPAGTPADRAVDAGVERLFHMATGAAENENTRSFAQTYLRCHHPVLGPVDAQAKQLGLKPQLARDAYTVERTWRALFDHREDVRRFAAAVAKVEMRAWGVQRRLFELCESDDKLVRNIALDAMLHAGDESADPDTTLTLDELSADAIFPLTESTKKSVRDAGMELIRKHYARLGGVERLSWLMQSAEREVRAFAVRLLWEKHRPRATPSTWKPRATTTGNTVAFDDAGRFVDGEAMRGFLRRVLFSLPPGAGPQVVDDDATKRSAPASVAKRRLVDVVRDVAVVDASFAAMVRPVLAEMTGSLARGEWQACLAAVAAIDAASQRRADEAAAALAAAASSSPGAATRVPHGGEA